MRVAVLVPGSGSGAGFVRRAFGPALESAGYELLTCEVVPGPDAVGCTLDRLAGLVDRHRAAMVGGVSLGAHLAARYAAEHPVGGLLLALPAWTGPPGAVAGASLAAAERIRRAGVAAALAEARGGGVPWVADELAAAWPAYGPLLADTLEATARSHAPAESDLAHIAAPAGVAGFVDDPLHPIGVAARWVDLLPRAALARLRLADCAADRAALGHAAVRAWQRARLRPREHRPTAPRS